MCEGFLTCTNINHFKGVGNLSLFLEFSPFDMNMELIFITFYVQPVHLLFSIKKIQIEITLGVLGISHSFLSFLLLTWIWNWYFITFYVRSVHLCTCCFPLKQPRLWYHCWVLDLLREDHRENLTPMNMSSTHT